MMPLGKYRACCYFALEVLSSQPQARQIFLLQTSLLGRHTAEQASSQILREIERSGLFLQALGGEPSWYRYHALFVEALQTQARQRLGEEELYIVTTYKITRTITP